MIFYLKKVCLIIRLKEFRKTIHTKTLTITNVNDMKSKSNHTPFPIRNILFIERYSNFISNMQNVSKFQIYICTYNIITKFNVSITYLYQF
jgi:hypothetical protein